jgi:transcriptional regulator with XRE-family HTH domain
MIKVNDKFLSKNLKLLRNRSRKSQDSFVQIFGLKRTNITSYEGGTEPRPSFLLAVANYFNIKLDDLVCSDLNLHPELLDPENTNVSPEKRRLCETPGRN